MRTLDPKLILLSLMVFFFTIALFYCEHVFPNDGQIFQVVATLLSGFAGILLSDLRKVLGIADPDSPNTVTTAATTTMSRTTSLKEQGPTE